MNDIPWFEFAMSYYDRQWTREDWYAISHWLRLARKKVSESNYFVLI